MLFTAGGSSAGFLRTGGADVWRIMAATVGAASWGGRGAFHEDLLHETLSKRVYIVRNQGRKWLSGEFHRRTCTLFAATNCTLLNCR